MNPPTYHVFNRVEDVSGVSGEGHVAYVVDTRFGSIIVWDTGFRTMGCAHDLAEVRGIHSHDGRTLIEPVGYGSPQADRARQLVQDLLLIPMRAWGEALHDAIMPGTTGTGRPTAVGGGR